MSKRWWVSALLGLSAMAVTGAAAAEPKTHDGFYFRGATGLGYTRASFSPGDGSIGGVSIGFDAWFGGSPTPGLAIGGGLTGYDVPSPTAKFNGTSGTLNGHETLSILALFGDYYFNPNQGLHLEGIVGFGALGFTNTDGSSGSDASGLALGLGFGNDWWVGDEWSIGVLGRFIYAPLSLDNTKYSTITPALMATFTYN